MTLGATPSEKERSSSVSFGTPLKRRPQGSRGRHSDPVSLLETSPTAAHRQRVKERAAALAEQRREEVLAKLQEKEAAASKKKCSYDTQRRASLHAKNVMTEEKSRLVVQKMAKDQKRREKLDENLSSYLDYIAANRMKMLKSKANATKNQRCLTSTADSNGEELSDQKRQQRRLARVH